MNLSLLECVYTIRDREQIERWLTQAELESVLISTMQYDTEMLAVLASEQHLRSVCQKIRQQPAIFSCEEKHAEVFRITTSIAPDRVIRSFPFREGEEWYQGSAQTAYLSLQSSLLSYAQLAWLATCPHILAWDFFYPLSPVINSEEHCQPAS